MFKILIIEDRKSICLGLRYLLNRYELVFGKEKDAKELLKENHIDLVLINVIKNNGSYSNWSLLKEWGKTKKTIVIMDAPTKELNKKAYDHGALRCIDKLDLFRLPHLVERYLNKSDTRVIDIKPR